MSQPMSPPRRRIGVAIAVLALVATACQPGLTLPDAGTGAAGSTGDGGPATSATFTTPGGLVVLPGGGYDIVDVGACTIRQVQNDGTVSTIAGTGTCGYSGDGGQATSAKISPRYNIYDAASGQLARDSQGNLYLADSGNAVVRRIATDGTITTVAGPGYSMTSACSGTDAAALGVTVTPDDSVYLSCPMGMGKLLANGTVQQITNTSTMALTSDASGNLYYSEYLSGRVMKMAPGGTPSVLATSAQGEVSSLTVAPDGSLYGGLGPVQDFAMVGGEPTFHLTSANRVVKIANGTMTNIGGNGAFDPGSVQSGDATSLALTPAGIAATPHGGLLVSSGHTVYRISLGFNDCNPSVFHSGADLSGRDLSGENLTGCDLSGINLTGADLTGAALAGVHGSGIIGEPAHLPTGWVVTLGYLAGPGVDLRGASLVGADFSGANLTGANLTGEYIVDADFSHANLTNAEFTRATLLRANLTDVTATGAGFQLADLTDANLTGATFHMVSFSQATLVGATVADADFGTADFYAVKGTGVIGTPLALPPGWVSSNGNLAGPNADLSGADLSGTDLSNTDLSDADLGNTTGTGIDLAGATLNGTNLLGAKFSGVNLAGTNFASAKVQDVPTFPAASTGVNLSGITGAPLNVPPYFSVRAGYLVGPGLSLAGRDLTGVDLSNLDFTGSNFTGDTFHATNITNTDFSNATFDDVRGDAITTTPLHLPYDWVVLNGRLIGDHADLSGLDLSGYDFTGASLAETNLAGTLLTNANLTGGTLYTANLTGADLTGANLTNVFVGSATLTGAKLANATLTGVYGAHLVGTPASLPAKWVLRAGVLLGPGAVVAEVNFTGLDLSGVDLTGGRLFNSNLTNVNLTGANLTNTNLSGTPLSGANLTDVIATGATGNPAGGSTAVYDNTTCPNGTVVSAPSTCVGQGFAN